MYDWKEMLEVVNKAIAAMPFDREPAALYDPIRYVLSLGGKRIRPVMMLMAYNLYKEDVETIMPQALGLETYHNYTLLHDDLMDRADVRRGMPTVHKKWNDNAAILSGDTMLVMAYRYMHTCADASKLAAVLDLFTETALQIGEGQQYDMEFEDRDDVTEDEYIEMIRLKTSVLLACALKMGALLAGAPADDSDRLYELGVNVGLAFQLQDDCLDVYGDPAVFGKKIGGDILCNKKTYMLINALRLAGPADREALQAWIECAEGSYQPEEKIAAVTALYNKMDIRALCERKIAAYFDAALAVLEALQVDEVRKQPLRQMVMSLLGRNV